MSEDVAANMTLADWVEACGFGAEQNGWHRRYNELWTDDDHYGITEHLIAKTALVGCEVSEAIEELRNGHEPTELYESEGGKPEGYGVELADVVIRVFDLAYMLNIDLTHIMEDKLRANKRRGQMHGGKKI